VDVNRSVNSTVSFSKI